jgi:hypothetical protein
LIWLYCPKLGCGAGVEESEGAGYAPGAPVDPAAVGLALAGASRQEADAFLRDQRKLIALQTEELSHELGVRHWSLWVRHASSVLKLTLELGVGLLLLALVAGISLMVWNAAHSDGLVIDSFSMPPDMASRGLTGQVVASQLLDRMTGLVNANSTVRAAKSFANSWGDDIKVEIPDTGVSVGEAYRFLKSWLGHETHINGEVWRTPAGIAITARVSGSGGMTIVGNEADVDVLVQKMAEKIFGATQPYRYGIYLDTHGRAAEAMLVFKVLATTGPPPERVWGYIGWYNALTDTAPIAVRSRLLERALTLQPDNILAINNLSSTRITAGQEEEAFRLENRLQSALRDNNAELIDTARLPGLRRQAQSARDRLLGAFRESAQGSADVIASGNVNVASTSFLQAQSEALAHDLAAARATMTEPAPSSGLAPGSGEEAEFFARLTIKSEANDWAGILSDARGLEAMQQKYPGTRDPVMAHDMPLIAYARAKLGDFSAAEETIRRTPGDCGPVCAHAPVSQNCGANMRAPTSGSFALRPPRLPSRLPMPNGVRRCWNAASRTKPSRSSSLQSRQARISPTRWKAGARR